MGTSSDSMGVAPGFACTALLPPPHLSVTGPGAACGHSSLSLKPGVSPEIVGSNPTCDPTNSPERLVQLEEPRAVGSNPAPLTYRRSPGAVPPDERVSLT